MDRPDINWYVRRLAGNEGYAIRDFLRHARVPDLLHYIEQLETELNDRDNVHQVQGIQET